MKRVFAFLLRYARPYVPFYLVGLVMIWATNHAIVRLAVLVGDVFNVLEAGGSAMLADSQALAVESMVWATVLVVVRTLSRVLFFNPGRDIQHTISVDLFGNLLRLQRPFFAERKVGELVSVATNDTQSVRLLVGFAGLQVCNVAVAIPLYVAQLVQTDAVLTAYCLAPVVLGGVYMRWTIRRFYTRVRKGMEQLAKLSDRILENYSGISALRAHVAEKAAVERFGTDNRAYLDLQLDLASIRAFSMPALAFSGLVSTGIVLWIGGNRVIEKEMAVGDLATFTGLLLALVGTLTALAWVLTAISRGVVALGRVDGLLQEPDGIPTPTARLAFVDPPRLELRGLDWTYPGADREALAKLDAVVEPGGTLGIFGRTGSGKTTLIELLSRLNAPAPGAVHIDGVDVMSVPLGDYRRQIAVVPQRPFLFSTTLRENIRLEGGERTGHLSAEDGPAAGDAPDAAVGVDDPRLDAVLDAACLAPDVAQLPDGLDTIVGERGVMLSGGQRQRTALARALYRRPKVLLLDDVLSAVDQATEVKLVDAIRGLKGGDQAPTTVIVSHRTSVLEHADEILVLEDGRIIERGTHAELVARGGSYAAAHAHQHEEAKP